MLFFSFASGFCFHSAMGCLYNKQYKMAVFHALAFAVTGAKALGVI